MEGQGNNHSNINIHNHNNSNTSSSCMMMENGIFYPMIMIPPFSHLQIENQYQNQNQYENENENESTNKYNNSKVVIPHHSSSSSSAAGCCDLMDETRTHNLKAKIRAHPYYPRLLSAYLKCQKVGAPPEVAVKLEEAEAMTRGGGGSGGCGGYIGEDPALDQFMEAYCEMLTKYEQEITKPYKEAMLFLSRIESQFKALTLFSSIDSPSSGCGDVGDRNGSLSSEINVNNHMLTDPSAEDRELKEQLLRKYSSYLGSLRQEFLKKKKKGKLPKEARQMLLDWWNRHYKWPYPSESQKVALAELTGLDQKQINNWFINQRKRHWKPSEDMQFVVMEAATSLPHAHPHYAYMDTVLANPFHMDVSPTLM